MTVVWPPNAIEAPNAHGCCPLARKITRYRGQNTRARRRHTMIAAMEPPGITRHRRPFLAPLWVTLLALLMAAGVACDAYYRIAPQPSSVLRPRAGRSEPGTIDDPPISAEGEQRAQRLAQMFGAGGLGRLDALYVSGERRAQQTAAPLPELLHVAADRYDVARCPAYAAGCCAVTRAEDDAGDRRRCRPAGISAAARRNAGGAGRGTAEPDLLYIVSVPSFGSGAAAAAEVLSPVSRAHACRARRVRRRNHRRSPSPGTVGRGQRSPAARAQ